MASPFYILSGLALLFLICFRSCEVLGTAPGSWHLAITQRVLAAIIIAIIIIITIIIGAVFCWPLRGPFPDVSSSVCLPTSPWWLMPPPGS